MSAENSKMLVFVCFFNVFSNCRLRKKHKMLVFMEYVCMYVRPKLTFVSFFMFFFEPYPYVISKIVSFSTNIYFESENQLSLLSNLSQGIVLC